MYLVTKVKYLKGLPLSIHILYLALPVFVGDQMMVRISLDSGWGEEWYVELIAECLYDNY